MLRRLLLLAACACCVTAQAQDYPNRPVVMVIPYAAGGPTDVLGRILAEHMGKSLNGTVLVENTVGAAGSIGVGRVARAPADGYTLSLGHWGTHVVNGAIYNLPYDLRTAFDPVAQLVSNPQVLVSKNAVPAHNLRELNAWVKANQDKISMATSGIGAPNHVAGVYYGNIIGAKLLMVPYRGAGPALQDLMAGQVDLMFDQAFNSIPQLRAGKIRGYAITAPARLASAPDLPTVDEAGLPGLYISIWHGLWVPRGTPRPVVMKLSAAVVDTLADAAVRKRLTDMGQELPTREQETPEGLGAYHKAEIDKWWPLIKAAGIKGE
ncbi:MAG TPA: tripartite tricarboxylate transporter substrate-binding protein [Burkholderiales bacterium]|jgi:tripartite-type tricarboxylate transporter receptor subunit TctC|nr:tripartite tricarboxylate transporter substrate-binding protein [Burkholderiales bacterium]